jgi:hypothetical protein
MVRKVILFGLIAVLLAGCGSGSTSAKPAATVSATAVSVPVCKQRYLAWRDGQAGAATKQFVAAQTNLQTVSSQKESQQAIAAIKTAAEADGQAAATLASLPVPACADPKGYLAAALHEVQAAAASASAATGLPGLVKALAPLLVVPELEGDFTTELDHTTGITP